MDDKQQLKGNETCIHPAIYEKICAEYISTTEKGIKH